MPCRITLALRLSLSLVVLCHLFVSKYNRAYTILFALAFTSHSQLSSCMSVFFKVRCNFFVLFLNRSHLQSNKIYIGVYFFLLSSFSYPRFQFFPILLGFLFEIISKRHVKWCNWFFFLLFHLILFGQLSNRIMWSLPVTLQRV